MIIIRSKYTIILITNNIILFLISDICQKIRQQKNKAFTSLIIYFYLKRFFNQLGTFDCSCCCGAGCGLTGCWYPPYGFWLYVEPALYLGSCEFVTYVGRVFSYGFLKEKEISFRR